MLKLSIVTLMLICLIGCASTSELDGLSACEKVEVLTQRVVELQTLAANDRGSEVAPYSGWATRLNDARRELAFAEEKCNASVPPDTTVVDGDQGLVTLTSKVGPVRKSGSTFGSASVTPEPVRRK